MKTIQPQNAKGTRDFGPLECIRRNYIFEIIEKHFKLHGFMPLQTPSMENLEILTGKYGEEGDKLLFKILNSGDYLSQIDEKELLEKNSRVLSRKISEKGLRYDLTVPFARYVSKNQNDLAFPFKRYQIQPVWRADRPQKGRYREFYQCDADIIGSNSLLCEVDLMQIYEHVFLELEIFDIEIKFNNRKILLGIAEYLNASDKMTDLTTAIDKLDKIGLDKVFLELTTKGFSEAQLQKLKLIFEVSGSNTEKLNTLSEIISTSEIGITGIKEAQKVFTLCEKMKLEKLQFDVTLARGLDYYTGSIYEVKISEAGMGSIGAGGRYDDLTSVFGVKDLPGIGISFGAERIYDVMESRGLFKNIDNSLDYLIINFDESMEEDYLTLAQSLRAKNHTCDIYPTNAKLKKQMTYADKRKVKNVIFFGESEKIAGSVKIKNLATGEEKLVTMSQI